MNWRYCLLSAAILLAGCAQMHVGTQASPREFVPAWAKSAVWYQVFPERFANGDPTNDPTVQDTAGAWPHDGKSPWHLSPWTSDWYELQPWERATGEDIWWNVQRRRYGGDLQGVIDKLDYLQDLGINALYLNPIFEAPSLHKYDQVRYHHVDPNFGPDPAGDRALVAGEDLQDPSTWVWTKADKLALKLVQEAHARGMRVIFDGVFNHMGVDSVPFRDVVVHQAQSPYKDWFTIKSWEDPAAGTHFDYEGWFGVKDLPELREDKNGLVEGPRRYIDAITHRWMDPAGNGDVSQGIDGWRLDVAFCIAHPYWKHWRGVVKSINPDAYLTAEVVDPPDRVKPYLQGDEFDAVMNYNFAFSCAEFFAQTTHGVPASEFDARLEELRNAFPGGVAYVQQNLLDSHDTNRVATHIVNRDRLDYRDWGKHFDSSKAANPATKVRKPVAGERAIQKLMALFQMTYVGAPMIYYGDEVGMWGANDPDCRKPMVWPDLKYQDEVVLPDGKRREHPDRVAFDTDLHDHYRRLIHLRNAHPALQTGDYETVLTDDARGVFAFRRGSLQEQLVVAVNNSDSTQSVELKPGVRASGWTDLLNSGLPPTPKSADSIEVSIAPKGGVVLAADPGWTRVPVDRPPRPTRAKPVEDKNMPTVHLTIRLEVPAGTPQVFITGSLPEWGPWDPAKMPLKGDGTQRTLDITVPKGTKLEYKFTLGSWQQELRDQDGYILDNFTLEPAIDTAVDHKAWSFGSGSKRTENLDPDGILGPPARDAWAALHPRFLETFLFPGGRSKAVVISMDDGGTQDRRLVALLNQHHLKGTFHINSGKLGDKDKVPAGEFSTLYAGHEVSGHSVHHPYFTNLTAAEVRSEVLEDEEALGRICGHPVKGLAYPFGATDRKTLAVLKELGVAYARTTGKAPNFALPQDPLLWAGSGHQSEAVQLAQLFLATDEKRLRLLLIWGHSWELDGKDANNNWDSEERFLSLVGDRPEIWSATFIEMADYVSALRGVAFAGDRVTNSSPQSIWLRAPDGHSSRELRPGETATL